MSDTPEYPVKRVSAKIGLKLFGFVLDEQDNFQNSAYDLIEEMHFFDQLADLFDLWLNRDADLLPGESIFYSLCSFARTQLFQGCAIYMRGHYSSGMVSARLAVEAAFYAEAVASGYLKEEEYLHDAKARNGLARKLRNFERGNTLPHERFKLLLDTVSLLSAHGAHAEVTTWGRRVMGSDEDGFIISFFENATSTEHLAYEFLGILWFASMSLNSFFRIASEKFGIDTLNWLGALESWKEAMEANKLKFGSKDIS
jgi:hypothetical protein